MKATFVFRPYPPWRYGDVLTGREGFTESIRLMYISPHPLDDDLFVAVVVRSDVPDADIGEKWNGKYHRWVLADD